MCAVLRVHTKVSVKNKKGTEYDSVVETKSEGLGRGSGVEHLSPGEGLG